MNYIYLGALILVCVSCKSVPPVNEKKIYTPKDYTYNSPELDSLHLKIHKLPALDQFYSDLHLKMLLDSAMTKNLDLKLMDAKVIQSKAGVTFSRGIRLPELQVGISSGVRKFGDYTIDGVGNYDTKFSPNLNDKQRIPNPVPDYFMGIHSSWEIDIWGKLKNQKVAAIRRYLSSEQGRQFLVTEVVAEIATAYYYLLTLDEQRRKLQRNIELQENALLAVEAEFGTGRATELAVQLSRSQLLETKKMLIEAEQDINEQENKLSLLTGSFPGRITRSTLGLSDSSIAKLSILSPQELLKNRPDILQAENMLIAANADLKSARKAFYPALQLNATTGLQAFKLAVLLEAPASIAFNAAAGMLMPVLNRRILKAQLMESSGRQKEAYVNYEKTILYAYKEVFELIQLDESLNKMIDLKNEELRILEESIVSVRALYATGRSTYLEKITTQEYFLQTQIELLELKFRKTQVQVAMYKAMGGGV